MPAGRMDLRLRSLPARRTLAACGGAGGAIMPLDIGRMFQACDGPKFKALRAVVLIAAGLQVLFWLYFFFYIGQHSNPKGDGMEWVAVMPATLILAIFVVPALQFGTKNRMLLAGLLLAAAGALLNIAFFAEIAREFAESGVQ